MATNANLTERTAELLQNYGLDNIKEDLKFMFVNFIICDDFKGLDKNEKTLMTSRFLAMMEYLSKLDQD